MTELTDTPVATVGGPRHRAKRPFYRRPVILTLIILVVLALVAGTAGAFYIKGQISPAANGAEVQLTIPKGASTASISTLLDNAGVIDNAKVFRAYVRIKGVGQFQAGDYT